jgi:hypothetical protein
MGTDTDERMFTWSTENESSSARAREGVRLRVSFARLSMPPLVIQCRSSHFAEKPCQSKSR